MGHESKPSSEAERARDRARYNEIRKGLEYLGRAQGVSFPRREAPLPASRIERISRPYIQKEEGLLEKVDVTARTVMLALGLGIGAYALGAATAETAPEKIIHPPRVEAQQEEKRGEPVVEIEKHQEDSSRREELYAKLLREIGVSHLAAIQRCESVHSSEEREALLVQKRDVQFKGFESFFVPEGEVEDYIEDSLPRFLSENVQTVSYFHHEKPTQGQDGARYGMAHSWKTAGEMDWQGNMNLYKPASECGSAWLLFALGHELGHASDPLRNRLLTLDERLELASAIVDQVKTREGYDSWYVNSIQNDDKQTEMALKSTEYFAEIIGAYCTEKYTELSGKDIRIIEEYLEKTDPGFDVRALRRTGRAFVDRHALRGEGESILREFLNR